ncbi:MAG TPA: ferrous iron transport protein B [Candidatus Ligilactobacillus excrementipullorum]|nr:ferrous iron transport protein B [Candidatus Ligilactobacillus excrementipullorum]
MSTIALAGNQNSGKTTLFNALTGSTQYVGNWPGVTVEKKMEYLKGNQQLALLDLPGVYSLSPYTLEERISRRYLIEEPPDLILDVVDSTNLERNLYLTLQLMETGLPLVLALNMQDLLKKQGRSINLKKLKYLLNIPVVSLSAVKKENIHGLIDQLKSSSTDLPEYPYPQYDDRLESALEMLGEVLQGQVAPSKMRWYTIKLFERDEEVTQQLKLTSSQQKEVTDIIMTAEKIFADSSDSIIVNARYDYVSKIMNMCVVDRNDFKMSLSERIDRVVTNKWLALPIFVTVMWLVYYLSIQTVGTIGTDWVNDVLFGQWLPNSVSLLLTKWQVAGWMKGLIIDGIIGGVGSVLGFIPQIMMLFLCLGILEDCGYMARIAFVMDRIFHRFNLSGKSFIPMLISTGCGVPGIMATRTIESEKDRKMTIMLTTFMPCSAKLTVIAMVAGTFFPHQSWVAPSAYFIGMLAVIGSGIFLKKTQLFAGPPQPFVMELPAYHLPLVENIIRYVWSRSKSFVQKAGTIIFASCVMIWFLSNFNWHLAMVSQNHSMLKTIGTLLAPLFAPLGFGDWRTTVAVLAGLIAKENCVSTLRLAFGSSSAQSFTNALTQTFTPMAGYAFLVFNLLCAPCFAAIGTMYKEYGDKMWTLKAVLYQTVLAYITALSIYQCWLIFSGHFSLLNVFYALCGIAVLIYGLLLKKERPLKPKEGQPI